MELLDAKLSDGLRRRLISGIQISRSAPCVSHLFFADDAIMFIRAKEDQATNLKRIIASYENISGQRVNYSKSEVVFSPNIVYQVRNSILSILQVKVVEKHGKYLGLPLVVGQKKCEAFKEIIEKVWRKTVDWKNNLLSAAGREVLVKSVLQSLPLYAMAVFLFPQKVRDQLSRMMINFWWNKRESRGIHWVNKKLLQEPKGNGGLGFKDLKFFNEALVMRLWWRVIRFPDLLLSRLIKGKYFPNSEFDAASYGLRPSVIWQSMFKVRDTFLRGIDQSADGDGYRWNQSSNGEFTTSSAYLLSKVVHEDKDGGRPGQSDNSKWTRFWKVFWASQVPNKVKIHNWRLYYNCLPDANNLIWRGIVCDTQCRLCDAQQEDINHLVKECEWSMNLWRYWGMDDLIKTLAAGNVADMLWWFALHSDRQKLHHFLVGTWLIWKNRNEIWHGKAGWDSIRAGLWGSHLLHSSNQPLFGSVDVNWLASCWRRSTKGELIVNIDGSWHKDSGTMGLGVVCRDSSGAILWVVARAVQGGSSASEAEGRALEWATALMDLDGMSLVAFEMDSTEVAEALVYKSQSWRWASGWLAPTLERMLKHTEWRMKVIPRNSNKVADWVARKACAEDWCWSDRDAIPISIGALL